MKKLLLFITTLLSAWIAFGEGPQYTHKDATVNKEFINAYQDIRAKMPIYSSSTFTVKGTTTNDNASTGYVGEYISSDTIVGTACPSTGQWGDYGQISLTAGDWDIDGAIYTSRNTATWTEANIGISTTSGNVGSNMDVPVNRLLESWVSSNTTPVEKSINIPRYRVSIPGSKTYYLKIQTGYSAGSPICRGHISARRVR